MSVTARVPSRRRAACDVPTCEAMTDGIADLSLEVGAAEVPEQPAAERGGEGLAMSWPRCRARAVDGLKERPVQGECSRTQPARCHLELCAEVGHDVAEQVVGHDDVEALRRTISMHSTST